MSSFPCAGAPGDLEQRFRLIPAADATTAPSCRGTRRQQRARCIDAIRGMFAMCMPGSIASLGGCGGRPKAQYTLKFPHGIPSRTNNGILKFGAYNGHHTDEKGYFYYLAADGQSDSLRAKKPKNRRSVVRAIRQNRDSSAFRICPAVREIQHLRLRCPAPNFASCA